MKEPKRNMTMLKIGEIKVKIEIFEDKAEQAEEPVRLRLVSDIGNDVAVVAVDLAGKRVGSGTILVFDSDGTFSRNPAVNPALGFSLDGGGYIKLRGGSV